MNKKDDNKHLSNCLNIDLCLDIMKVHKDFIVYDTMYFSVSKYVEEQEQKIEELEQKIKELNLNYNDAVEDAEKYKSKCDTAIKLYKNCKEENFCTLFLDMYQALK